ncbi:MAG: hypothetical protein GZ085_03865 [Sulfuriferula multivorans]|uniref:Lipoprotein n=1 Tax=Sulfuriferula multivorans TaxID=1559896 RepID=A0A7C9NZ22_9PROT|nr:hypothetical protein [Sulfuriferula multivorans]
MRSLALTPLFSATALFAALTGCATPQYQNHVRLIPPTDAQGLACVHDCDVQKNLCQTHCQTRYQACLKEIEPKVEASYTDALKHYENELEQYAAALRHYELQMRFDWLNSYPYRHPYGWYTRMMPTLPPPYLEPVMPTRESVRAQLQASSCKADCGCLPAEDSCFVGCGGQRKVELLCIENCPPEK